MAYPNRSQRRSMLIPLELAELLSLHLSVFVFYRAEYIRYLLYNEGEEGHVVVMVLSATAELAFHLHSS